MWIQSEPIHKDVTSHSYLALYVKSGGTFKYSCVMLRGCFLLYSKNAGVEGELEVLWSAGHFLALLYPEP